MTFEPQGSGAHDPIIIGDREVEQVTCASTCCIVHTYVAVQELPAAPAVTLTVNAHTSRTREPHTVKVSLDNSLYREQSKHC